MDRFLAFRVRGKWDSVLSDETKADTFTDFVTTTEERLRLALTATHGPELGREGAAEALAYGWEHWERISTMENPAGYLYRVGHNRAKRMRRRPMVLPKVDRARDVWVEPALPEALADLSEKQRTVVALLYGMQWSMSEVAEALGITKASVQKHAERGMKRLRRRLGVDA